MSSISISQSMSTGKGANASAGSGGTIASPLSPSANAAQKTAAKSKHGGFSFGDLLDVINPLQHIPIISTIYRAITHDKIRPEAQIAGDALFGGPIGLAASVADEALRGATGKTVEGHVMALFKGKGKVTVGPVEFAENKAKGAPGAATSKAGLMAGPVLEPKPKTIPASGGAAPTLSASALDRLMQSVNETKASQLEQLAAQYGTPPPAAETNRRNDAYRKALEAAEAAMQKWQARAGDNIPSAMDKAVGASDNVLKPAFSGS